MAHGVLEKSVGLCSLQPKLSSPSVLVASSLCMGPVYNLLTEFFCRKVCGFSVPLFLAFFLMAQLNSKNPDFFQFFVRLTLTLPLTLYLAVTGRPVGRSPTHAAPLHLDSESPGLCLYSNLVNAIDLRCHCVLTEF